MAVDFSLEVVGLKEALKELNQIDKKLRRQVTTDFKKIMAPVVDDAKSRIPDNAPLSGMSRSWTSKSGAELMAWDDTKVNKNLKAFTSGKKVRDTGLGFVQNLAVFGVRWNGPQVTQFDQGRKGAMARQLGLRYGSPSRLLWRSYETKRPQVEQEIRNLVSEVMRKVGRGGII